MNNSESSCLANDRALFIALAATGFIRCVKPYFVFNNVKSSKTDKVTSLIEEQYAMIHSKQIYKMNVKL